MIIFIAGINSAALAADDQEQGTGPRGFVAQLRSPEGPAEHPWMVAGMESASRPAGRLRMRMGQTQIRYFFP